MSKLSQLQGKSKTYEIGGLELDIHPLDMDDLGFFNTDENTPREEKVKLLKELFRKVLKESVPDATEEEIKKVAFEYVDPLMKAIMEVNNIKTDKLSVIKDAIKSRQAQKQAPQ